ncbi:MAG: metal-dependent phosphohydrolase [Cyanobacteria bacterium J06638_28]
MMNLGANLFEFKGGYRKLFGESASLYDVSFMNIAAVSLLKISRGDAPYHTVQHTLQAMRVGHLIQEGKQYYEGSVSPFAWLQFMVSLLCHDIGYVKGVLKQDNRDRHLYFDGKYGRIKLSPTATGAALEDHHVNRSKAYVAELEGYPLNLPAIQWNIEMTRFPVPHQAAYGNTLSTAGLCRAADLISQLSAPDYRDTLPALFQEFQSTGMSQDLGFQSVEHFQAEYPNFYWNVVYPYIKPSFRYLMATAAGRQQIAQVYTNLCMARHDQPLSDRTAPELQNLETVTDLLPWQEAGFMFT